MIEISVKGAQPYNFITDFIQLLLALRKLELLSKYGTKIRFGSNIPSIAPVSLFPKAFENLSA